MGDFTSRVVESFSDLSLGPLGLSDSRAMHKVGTLQNTAQNSIKMDTDIGSTFPYQGAEHARAEVGEPDCWEESASQQARRVQQSQQSQFQQVGAVQNLSSDIIQ